MYNSLQQNPPESKDKFTLVPDLGQDSEVFLRRASRKAKHYSLA